MSRTICYSHYEIFKFDVRPVRQMRELQAFFRL
jgi:hypothetical protein